GDPVDLSDLVALPRTPEVVQQATDRIMEALTEQVAEIRGGVAPGARLRAGGSRRPVRPGRVAAHPGGRAAGDGPHHGSPHRAGRGDPRWGRPRRAPPSGGIPSPCPTWSRCRAPRRSCSRRRTASWKPSPSRSRRSAVRSPPPSASERGDPVALSDLVALPRTPEVVQQATDRIMEALTEQVAEIRGEVAPAERF